MDTLAVMFGLVVDLLCVWLPFLVPAGAVAGTIYILRKRVNNAG